MHITYGSAANILPVGMYSTKINHFNWYLYVSCNATIKKLSIFTKNQLYVVLLS